MRELLFKGHNLGGMNQHHSSRTRLVFEILRINRNLVVENGYEDRVLNVVDDQFDSISNPSRGMIKRKTCWRSWDREFLVFTRRRVDDLNIVRRMHKLVEDSL